MKTLPKNPPAAPKSAPKAQRTKPGLSERSDQSSVVNFAALRLQLHHIETHAPTDDFAALFNHMYEVAALYGRRHPGSLDGLLRYLKDHAAPEHLKELSACIGENAIAATWYRENAAAIKAAGRAGSTVESADGGPVRPFTPPVVEQAEPPMSALRGTDAQERGGVLLYEHDLGGMASGQAFEHDECVAIFCLALAAAERPLREVFIPELTSLREQLGWLETLTVAKFIVQRRTLGRMTGDAPNVCFRLPLPGVAGMAECSYAVLMDDLASRLWMAREALLALVGRKLVMGDDAALFGEALALAEFIVHRGGIITDLGEDEFPQMPNLKPSTTLRCAWNYKVEADRAA